MKTTLTLLALLLTTLSFGQYRTEKALIEQLKAGRLSVESYSDMALSVLENRSDSIRIEFVKPHYNACLDLAIIGGGVMYQKFGNNVKYDYILHFWGGYFATKGMIYGLDRMGLNKTTSAIVPPLITSALCLIKEYMLDSQVSKGDLIAGIGGAGMASVSYTIDIEKLFRRK